MPQNNADANRAMQILAANASKNFVDRVLRPDKYPTLDLGDGNSATHKMAWGEANGKYVVFPTIHFKDGKLTDLGSDRGFDEAMKTKEYIEFDDPKEAEWFSQRYKSVWGQ